MKQNVQEFGGKKAGAPGWARALWRGMKRRCPRCGHGRLFSGYVATADTCERCGLEFSGHRADDAPPYITIMIVGHIAIPLALAMKQIFDPPVWMQFAIWAPVMGLATFWLLPVAKGGLIALQWANRMHGFAGPDADPAADA